MREVVAFAAARKLLSSVCSFFSAATTALFTVARTMMTQTKQIKARALAKIKINRLLGRLAFDSLRPRDRNVSPSSVTLNYNCARVYAHKRSIPTESNSCATGSSGSALSIDKWRRTVTKRM